MHNSIPTLLVLPLALALTACGGSDEQAKSAAPSNSTTPAAGASSEQVPAADSSSSDAASTAQTTPSTETTPEVAASEAAASSAPATKITAKSGAFTIQVPAGFKASNTTNGANEVALSKGKAEILIGSIKADQRASSLKGLRELCGSTAKEMGGSLIDAKPRMIGGDKAEGCVIEMPKGDGNGRAVGRSAAYLIKHNGTDYATVVAPGLPGKAGQAAIDDVLGSLHWVK